MYCVPQNMGPTNPCLPSQELHPCEKVWQRDLIGHVRLRYQPFDSRQRVTIVKRRDYGEDCRFTKLHVVLLEAQNKVWAAQRQLGG
jgi:hypothetical protein